jgi:hypothetical protein
MDASEAEKLQATLRHHSLALQAEAEQACFVNMWIALESLVRGRGGRLSNVFVNGFRRASL